MDSATLTLLLVGFVCVGILALWGIRIRYDLQTYVPDRSQRTSLQVAAWVCIGVGIFGLQVHLAVQASPIMCLITLIILITSIIRYRASELRSFLGCLAAAAERGIPLEQAARAFSYERTGVLGTRAARLAQSLESGIPISQALPQLWWRVPFDILLALRLGVATGDVGGALNTISKPHDQAEHLLRGILEKLLYLAAITFVLFVILAFTMLKIVPVFEKMFLEFEITLPSMTRFTIFGTTLALEYWFIPTPLFLLFLFTLSVGWLYYLYLLPRDLPLINRLSLRWDAALIMRSLSAAVRQRLPFEQMVELLAEHFPRTSVRNRLREALTRMARAEPWQSALRQVGILRVAEAGLLNAAQRSGNLEWALEELADSSMRRLTYRIQIIVSIAMPVIMLGYGCIIGFIVIALFMPLVSLIMGLS